VPLEFPYLSTSSTALTVKMASEVEKDVYAMVL
jgi:hypothetical protein